MNEKNHKKITPDDIGSLVRSFDAKKISSMKIDGISLSINKCFQKKFVNDKLKRIRKRSPGLQK